MCLSCTLPTPHCICLVQFAWFTHWATKQARAYLCWQPDCVHFDSVHLRADWWDQNCCCLLKPWQYRACNTGAVWEPTPSGRDPATSARAVCESWNCSCTKHRISGEIAFCYQFLTYLQYLLHLLPWLMFGIYFPGLTLGTTAEGLPFSFSNVLRARNCWFWCIGKEWLNAIFYLCLLMLACALLQAAASLKSEQNTVPIPMETHPSLE